CEVWPSLREVLTFRDHFTAPYSAKSLKRPKSHYTAPACGFQIAKIFQLEFFTNDSARPRHNWGLTASRELKRVKRISVFFS
ncbi:hypothetical protein ACM53I_005270, partial [Enterobacter hormaechei]